MGEDEKRRVEMAQRDRQGRVRFLRSAVVEEAAETGDERSEGAYAKRDKLGKAGMMDK